MTSVGDGAKQRERQTIDRQSDADGMRKEDCVKYETIGKYLCQLSREEAEGVLGQCFKNIYLVLDSQEKFNYTFAFEYNDQNKSYYVNTTCYSYCSIANFHLL